MILLLLPPALASGVMKSHVQLVDHQCGVYGEAARAEWPVHRPLRVTGHLTGTTSAPGGPTQHHHFELEPDHLGVYAGSCRVAEPGVWVRDGTCDGSPVYRWTGAMVPGERMAVGEGWAVASVQVAGASEHRACPPEPPPRDYVDERTPLGQDTVSIVVPAEALAVEPGFVALDAQWVTDQLDGLYVMGATHLAVQEPPQITGPMPGTLTVARTRRRFDEEDGLGAEWCTTVQEVQVTVTVDGIDAVWTFVSSEDNARVQVDGWCS